jgi:hypothetical protein
MRPAFSEVLELLQEIKQSSFVKTPYESFRTMQNDWKSEIECMFEELRSKEQVRVCKLLFFKLCLLIM